MTSLTDGARRHLHSPLSIGASGDTVTVHDSGDDGTIAHLAGHNSNKNTSVGEISCRRSVPPKPANSFCLRTVTKAG